MAQESTDGRCQEQECGNHQYGQQDGGGGNRLFPDVADLHAQHQNGADRARSDDHRDSQRYDGEVLAFVQDDFRTFAGDHLNGGQKQQRAGAYLKRRYSNAEHPEDQIAEEIHNKTNDQYRRARSQGTESPRPLVHGVREQQKHRHRKERRENEEHLYENIDKKSHAGIIGSGIEKASPARRQNRTGDAKRRDWAKKETCPGERFSDCRGDSSRSIKTLSGSLCFIAVHRRSPGAMSSIHYFGPLPTSYSCTSQRVGPFTDSRIFSRKKRALTGSNAMTLSCPIVVPE